MKHEHHTQGYPLVARLSKFVLGLRHERRDNVCIPRQPSTYWRPPPHRHQTWRECDTPRTAGCDTPSTAARSTCAASRSIRVCTPSAISRGSTYISLRKWALGFGLPKPNTRVRQKGGHHPRFACRLKPSTRTAASSGSPTRHYFPMTEKTTARFLI